MRVQEAFHPGMKVDRYTMPYALGRPPGRVLIVGAGTGNDVEVALVSGAETVTAVEIDSTIFEIGLRHHPQHPYSDPRVLVIIDDARHFLKTTRERFDIILFSHLDAHTVLSSYTNVRLDNYIYTVEAFRDARARLNPGGMLYVSFWAEQSFVAARLGTNLYRAFGYAPIALEEIHRLPILVHLVNFVTGERGLLKSFEKTTKTWPNFSSLKYDPERTVASTDDWPFLYLPRPSLPPLILLLSGVALFLAGGLIWRMRPRGTRFDGRLFWLGAAFMLLEVHNVSRLALVFGTTWQVNAWVIAVILILILSANAVCMELRRRGRKPGKWAIAGLFVSLAAAYAIPLDWLAASSLLMQGLFATSLLSLPIFFAGLVFAQSFSESPTPGFALGWNALGAVVGGMAENASYVWGIPALVPLAAIFYMAAILHPAAGRRSTLLGMQ